MLDLPWTHPQPRERKYRLTPPELDGDIHGLGPPPPLVPGERVGSEILSELRADER